MDLKSIERDYVKVLRIQIFLLMLLVCGVLGFLAFKTRDESHFPLLFAGALVLFIFLLVYYPEKIYKYTKYGMVDKVFYVCKGKWFRKRTAVAQNRIQHTDVSQGPIARKYDLATLTIHTAGMKEADIHISGLKHTDAVAMRDFLLLLNKQAVNDQIITSESLLSQTKTNPLNFDLTPDEHSIATSVLAFRLAEEE